MKQKHLIKSVLASGLELSLETGKIASLTDGAVVARCGRTVVIATAVADTGWRDIAKGGDPEASAESRLRSAHGRLQAKVCVLWKAPEDV